MNQDRDLHRIAPSVYVDGFKAYKSSLQSPSSHFILTHYHADHYTGLERGNKGRSSVYGTIHTTSITKKLIDDHHFAADDPDPHAPPPPTNSTLACTLTSHAYATEWTLPLLPTPTAPAPHFLTVVFYPANHCPGAAIVVYRDSGESWWHVHCGDMRYSPKMKLYPHLRPPNKIHTIYLDTTYGNSPNCTFLPQESAIKEISDKVKEVFDAPTGDATLVLLSTYNMGKEKILYKCCVDNGKKIYVVPRKKVLLECVDEGKGGEAYPEGVGEDHLGLLAWVETDPRASNMHVIPMNVAGKMHPYFQPDFRKCADYADMFGSYDKVVAFIPTGWAGLGKWNKEHQVNTAVVTRRLEEVSKGQVAPPQLAAGTVEVTVILVPYSEHSTFSELEDFVEFCNPVKVVPTVYSGEAEREKIVKHFTKYCDRKVAKKDGFDALFGGSKGSGGGGKVEKKVHTTSSGTTTSARTVEKKVHTTTSGTTTSARTGGKKVHTTSSATTTSAYTTPAPTPKPAPMNFFAKPEKKKAHLEPSSGVSQLVNMGFRADLAALALKRTRNDITQACSMLLDPNGVRALEEPAGKKATIDSYFGGKK